MTIRSMLQARYQSGHVIHIHYLESGSGDLLSHPVSKDWASAYLLPLLVDTTAWRWDRDSTSRWLMSTIGSPGFNDLFKKQIASGDHLFLDPTAVSPGIREYNTELLNGEGYGDRHHPRHSQEATAAQFEAWYNHLGGDPAYTGTTNQTTNTTSTKENTTMAQNTFTAPPLKIGYAEVKEGHVGQVSFQDKIIWQSEPIAVLPEGYENLAEVANALATDAVAEFYRAAFSDIPSPATIKPLK